MTVDTVTPSPTDVHDGPCPEHDLALELYRRATGESLNDDVPLLFEDWAYDLFGGTFTACDQCEGKPPVEVEFHCNREEQLTRFLSWPRLGILLENQIKSIEEEPDSYDPEPVDGTDEERAAWYRKLIEIALECESSDQHDWYFVLRVSVGETESSSFVRSQESWLGSDVVAIRPFLTLAEALAHRAALGTDDFSALSLKQLQTLVQEVRDVEAK